MFGDDARASALRAILRASVVIATAFGLGLTASQVAAIQLGIEAAIQGYKAWSER